MWTLLVSYMRNNVGATLGTIVIFIVYGFLTENRPMLINLLVVVSVVSSIVVVDDNIHKQRRQMKHTLDMASAGNWRYTFLGSHFLFALLYTLFLNIMLMIILMIQGWDITASSSAYAWVLWFVGQTLLYIPCALRWHKNRYLLYVPYIILVIGQCALLILKPDIVVSSVVPIIFNVLGVALSIAAYYWAMKIPKIESK